MGEIRIQIDSKSHSSAQDLPGPSRRAVSSRVYFKNIKLDIFIDTTTHILRSWIARRLVAHQLVVYYRSRGEKKIRGRCTGSTCLTNSEVNTSTTRCRATTNFRDYM